MTMAILALTSMTGAPGVTTSALGLALHWPRGVLLVDVDPVPSQAIEAGYLGRATPGAGLLDVAHCCRQQGPVTQALWASSVPLERESKAGQSGAVRRYLSGFSHPGGAAVVASHWPQIAGSLVDLELSGVDVILDLGRWGPGPARALMERIDQLLILTHSTLRGLAGLKLNLSTAADQAEQLAPRCQLGLAVIGPSRPYTSSEVGQTFGLPVAMEVPWFPAAAQVFSDGGGIQARRSGALAAALRTEAARLARGLGQRARLLTREPVGTSWR